MSELIPRKRPHPDISALFLFLNKNYCSAVVLFIFKYDSKDKRT